MTLQQSQRGETNGTKTNGGDIGSHSRSSVLVGAGGGSSRLLSRAGGGRFSTSESYEDREKSDLGEEHLGVFGGWLFGSG